jgi:hypothetical protein
MPWEPIHKIPGKQAVAPNPAQPSHTASYLASKPPAAAG